MPHRTLPPHSPPQPPHEGHPPFPPHHQGRMAILDGEHAAADLAQGFDDEHQVRRLVKGRQSIGLGVRMARKVETMIAPTPFVEIMIDSVPVMLKLESYTPPGSHKGRAARLIANDLIAQAVRQALLLSSGNMADAMAYYTRDTDIELIVITDMLSPQEFHSKLRQYPHVDLRIVDCPDASGSHLAARHQLARGLLDEIPTIIEIDQYSDRRIPFAYETTLCPEIDSQLEGNIGAVVLPTGTGGLLNGVLRFANRQRKNWTIIGVDAVGSSLHWSVPPDGQKRHWSGYGNGGQTEFISECCRRPYNYHLVHVSDRHTLAAMHRLFNRDGLLLGPSSGAVIAAIEIILNHRPDLIPDRGCIVAVMPDGGENYRSTAWNDDWLIKSGFGSTISSRV